MIWGGDGLTNLDEADVYGTDPLSPDTDGDGVSDYHEIKGWSIDDAGEVVHDEDGITTDPINPDTDFDGWFDGPTNRDGILKLHSIDCFVSDGIDYIYLISDCMRRYPGYGEWWEFTPGEYEYPKAVIDRRVETRWPTWNEEFNTVFDIWIDDIILEEIVLDWEAPDDPDGYNEYEVDIVRENQWGEVVRDYTFTFRSYVNYFADPDPLDFDHEHDTSGDGISDADTYRLSSDPQIDGRAHPLRKDVFVEVDWMEGVDRLSDEAKWRIGTRFYENDIWLHIDDGKMGGGGELDDYEEKIRNSNWGLDRGYFYHQEKPGFHYSLLAYKQEEDSFLNRIRGNAPAPGLRFAIYTKRASGTDWQVHVFLHEIGHNLIGRYYVDNPDHPRHNPLANHFVYEDDRDYRVHCGCDDCALRQGSWSPRSDLCGNCWDAMNFQWEGWRSR